jgi:hypothetical protein
LLKPRHKIKFFLFVLSMIIPILGVGEEYWQQFVHYTIYARLNNNRHLIEAYETLLYQNNSPDTLSELYFHLYPNAFQKNSIMTKEAKAVLIDIISSPENIGWIKIDSLFIAKPPAHQNATIDTSINDTILKIKLFPHLYPGEQLSISLKFVTKVRKYNPAGGKGGYGKNLYEVSQWYPKICVYDKKGWHPDKYHWLGEFYGEFGTFDVTLNVPDSFIVAATGEIVSGDPGWKSVEIDSNCNLVSQSNSTHQSSNHDENQSSRRIVTFHAENVHDFVWTASAEYLYQSTVWQDVPIHILFRKSSQKQWHNMALKGAKNALRWLNDLIGEYPYPQLTVCEGVLAGGMEYPMVTILGNVDLTLIVHEIGHMYFYGAVANNELDEGWLDEGIITYISELLVEENGKSQNTKTTAPIPIKIHFINQQFGLYELKDIKLNSLYYYFYSGFEKPISTRCYELKNRYLYTYNVYLKSSKFFAMLEYLVGRETFEKILQAYYQQWKFKHVDGEILKKVCEQVSGIDLDWFFDQWIHKTARIDYACTDVISQKQKNGDWKTDVTIKRLGDGIMPIETEFITEAGDTIRQRWKGDERVSTISLLTHSKVKNFQLDPDDVILDQNRLNNSYPRVKPYLYPEFLSMYYLPRDAYSLFGWPGMWYNDVDGFKVGVRLLGSYLNRYYVTRNYFWYGIKSHQFGFNLGYSMPWERIDKNLWRHLYLLKIEGRTEINLNISYNLSKQFAGYQSHGFRFGFSHQQVNDNQYTYRLIKSGNRKIKVQEWSKGTINKLYFSYSTNCINWLPQSNLNFDGQISNEAWESDFNYIRLSLNYRFTLGSARRNWKVSFRNYVGYSYQKNDQIPIQDMFWIAEGNPNQRFKYFYLRSIGSLPTWLNYHFPGDGNLRGYFNKLIRGSSPLTANKLISTNIDFIHRKAHYLLPKKLRGFVQGIDFTLFFDAGRVWIDDINKDYLFDAGFGLIFYKKILGKHRNLRIDFPIYVNHPELDRFSPSESSWKFRWIVSFQ